MRFAPASFECHFDQLQAGWIVRLVGSFPPPFADYELVGTVTEVSHGSVGTFIRLGVEDSSYIIARGRIDRIEVLDTRNAVFVTSRQPL
jgi:hypothetical protein